MADVLSGMFGGEGGKRLNDSDSKLLKKCQSIVKEAVEARGDITERWQKNERLYMGNPADQKDTRSQVKHFIALSVIEDEIPTFGDYMPSVDVVGEAQNDAFFADQIHRRVQQLVEGGRILDKLLDVVKNGHIYSDGIAEILPVMKPKSGLTEEELEEYRQLEDDDPRKMEMQTLDGIEAFVHDTLGYFPDPMGDGWDITSKSRYLVIADIRPIKDIEQEYGLDPGTIKGGNYNLADFKGFFTNASHSRDAEKFQKSMEQSKSDHAVVFKIYWNCQESLSAESEERGRDEDELGQSPEELKESYPNGRCTLICEDTILYDSKLEIPRAPVFGYKNYSVANKLFGLGETELASAPNFLINYLSSNMADNVKDFGNPKRLIKRTLARRIASSLRTSKNIEVDDKDDLSYLQAQNIPSSTFHTLEYTKELLNQATGVQSIIQGKPPTGVQSGIAIRALYEASQTRIRHKIKHDLEPELKNIGEYLVWLIQNYDEEIITIRGELEQTGEPKHYDYDPVNKYRYDEGAGKYVKYTSTGGEPEDAIDFITLRDTRVNIRIEPGNGGEKGRAARALEALEMYQSGIIPYYRLVSELNLQDKAELIKWYNDNNTARQIISSLKDIAEKTGGARNLNVLSNQFVVEQLYRLLQQVVDIDIDKL